MDAPEQPQIYLITPPEVELSQFPAQLAAVLDAHPVACVRMALSTQLRNLEDSVFFGKFPTICGWS